MGRNPDPFPLFPARALFLGAIPATKAPLAHQPQGPEVQPPPHRSRPTLADLQLTLVNATAALRQIQTHRLAIRWTRSVLPGVTEVSPQHTSRPHSHRPSLGLHHRLPARQTP